MRRTVFGITILVLATGSLFFVLSHSDGPKKTAGPRPHVGIELQKQPKAGAESNIQPLASSTYSDAIKPGVALANEAGEAPPPSALVTNLPPPVVVQNARRAVVQYAQVFGSNPVGNNPEITAALSGQNSRQINFLSPEYGLQVNAKGEMLDAWGTPLFFHQLSSHEMEIRSAGEDKMMWTTDDMVTR